ncbi:short-chain dehydrogenase [Edwardsiella hoshinae]|uniref:Short-chain dehydrogenase n=1 Tax=Edwardsiella hoshinae TaxID=93378 RepID=A0ABN4SX52_9GAMM|nr:SDR family oxidoreductase [Edwardsiella hoshinae]AOV97593.1 short-chain dehydrogenase [Edwardsiella hoshinae]
MTRFNDKIVLVTGGASGLGENLVRRLAQEGARIALADNDPLAAQAVCDTLPELAFPFHCDVSDHASVNQMVSAVINQFGRIDILFNHAGIGLFTPFLEISETAWRKVIDVNLTGCFLVGQAVAREMVRLGLRGTIVNTASIGALRATPYSAAYGPSKAGVVQLTRLMSLELAPHGIRVNAVCPGSAITPLTEATRNNPEKYQRMLSKYSMGRFAYPDEITSVMLFLASEQASYVHGDSYIVDSGYTTH